VSDAAARDVPVRFFDSHAHLADPAFVHDLDATLARLRDAGGVGVICIGESIAAAETASRIAARHPGFVWWTAGVHPHDAATFDSVRDETRLAAFVNAGAVAIGECGLDYHYDHSPRAAQRTAFGRQIALAAQTSRPLVVHTREAEPDTGALVRAAGASGVRGVLHCFTGSITLAETALDAGWYISFSGIITFRKWVDVALLQAVPSDRLLTESDSPYLAPVPHRGRRNEPAWVAHTVARLAAVRGDDPAALGDMVSENAARFFALAAHSGPS
jgi:TatD DNase family protein